MVMGVLSLVIMRFICDFFVLPAASPFSRQNELNGEDEKDPFLGFYPLHSRGFIPSVFGRKIAGPSR